MNTESCPRVSVIMPSFNHARFIAQAVVSVLGQTMSDLELLVIDDGSADQSPAIISKIKDSRIRYELLKTNQGACEAMNIGLRMAAGRFVAVCNSDDEWLPDKLERQLAVLDTGTRAVAAFSDAEWIDDCGSPLVGGRAPPFASVFKQDNRSRWTWMRDLLEDGNKLCHPSVLIRRDVYDTIGGYDNRLRQLPDLDLWIRVLARYDIFVMPEKLVRFRIHGGNTSTPSRDVSCRSINEHRLILRKTISDLSSDNFFRAFGFEAMSVDDEIDLQIEKALYLIGYEGIYSGMFRQLGLELIYDLMNDDAGVYRVFKKYGFDIHTFHREMAVHSPWLEGLSQGSQIKDNLGVGWRQRLRLRLAGYPRTERIARILYRLLVKAPGAWISKL